MSGRLVLLFWETATLPRQQTTPPPDLKRYHLDKRAALLLTIAEGSDPDQMLTTPEAAAFLGCSVQFLEIGRISGYGPPCTHVAPRMVRYKRRSLLAWLRQRRDLYARGYAPRSRQQN